MKTTDDLPPTDDEILSPDEVQEPFEKLLNFLLHKALELLEEHEGFLPFGAFYSSDGLLQVVTGDTGEEYPEPEDVLDALLVKLRRLAGGGDEVLAVGIASDVEVEPPEGGPEPVDAVAIELEHRCGWSETDFVPYEIQEDGQVLDGELWGCEGEPRVFVEAAGK